VGLGFLWLGSTGQGSAAARFPICSGNGEQSIVRKFCTVSKIPLLAKNMQQATAGGAKKRLEGAVGWFKGLGAATTNLVAGKATSDAAEDPEYVKVRAMRVHWTRVVLYCALSARLVCGAAWFGWGGTSGSQLCLSSWLSLMLFAVALAVASLLCRHRLTLTQLKPPVSPLSHHSRFLHRPNTALPQHCTAPTPRRPNTALPQHRAAPNTAPPQVRDYLAQLESHLGEAARQAGRLVAKETELTDALGEFGQVGGGTANECRRGEGGRLQPQPHKQAATGLTTGLLLFSIHHERASRTSAPAKTAHPPPHAPLPPPGHREAGPAGGGQRVGGLPAARHQGAGAVGVAPHPGGAAGGAVRGADQGGGAVRQGSDERVRRQGGGAGGDAGR